MRWRGALKIIALTNKFPMAVIIDGKKIANDTLSGLKQRLAALPFRPVLCDVVVGDDPVSLSYVKIKQKTAEKTGLDFRLVQLAENSTTAGVIAALQITQQDRHLCGLIAQLPLPGHLDKDAVLSAINSAVDVDCISPKSAALFYGGSAAVCTPPTAGAIVHILEDGHLGLELEKKKILVVGQGELVGRPVTFLLRQKGYNVVTADRSTAMEELSSLALSADVIISGAGRAKLITKLMVKPGAVVIDAGTSESGADIVGDVDFEGVREVALAISPVPGGVGPVTVAKLLENVVKVAEKK
jgi:methylenetetrahydrofolate dehydrogenase (NADP+) / methenyltetrahydrofolate cyclohydrolase